MLKQGFIILLLINTLSADARPVIAAEWMYHPYHFEMYQS